MDSTEIGTFFFSFGLHISVFAESHVGRSRHPRTPTSAAPNRIDGDYSAANDVSPAMLLTSDELRQFEVNLRLIHGTHRSYAAHSSTPEAVRSTGSSDRISLRHMSSESIMEQRR
jgi:hypothetical protein